MYNPEDITMKLFYDDRVFRDCMMLYAMQEHAEENVGFLRDCYAFENLPEEQQREVFLGSSPLSYSYFYNQYLQQPDEVHEGAVKPVNLPQSLKSKSDELFKKLNEGTLTLIEVQNLFKDVKDSLTSLVSYDTLSRFSDYLKKMGGAGVKENLKIMVKDETKKMKKSFVSVTKELDKIMEEKGKLSIGAAILNTFNKLHTFDATVAADTKFNEQMKAWKAKFDEFDVVSNENLGPLESFSETLQGVYGEVVSAFANIDILPESKAKSLLLAEWRHTKQVLEKEGEKYGLKYGLLGLLSLSRTSTPLKTGVFDPKEFRSLDQRATTPTPPSSDSGRSTTPTPPSTSSTTPPPSREGSTKSRPGG